MNTIERSLLINSTYLSANLGQIHVLLAIDSLQNFHFWTVQSRQAQAMLLPIKKKRRQANIEKVRVFYDRKRAAKTMTQQDPTTLAVAFDFQKPCRDRLIIVCRTVIICVCVCFFLRCLALHEGFNLTGLENATKSSLSGRDKGKLGGRVYNTKSLTPDDQERIVKFIKSFAEDNGLALPGRIPWYHRTGLKLLPSQYTKTSVWKSYQAVCQESGMNTFIFCGKKVSESIIMIFKMLIFFFF